MNGPQITCFGRLVKDPKLAYTVNEGTPYSRVRIAVNTYYGPGRERETHFFQVTLWKRHAETLVSRCRKGDEIFVAGTYSHLPAENDTGRQNCRHRINATQFRQAGTRQDENPIAAGDTPAPDQNSQDDQGKNEE